MKKGPGERGQRVRHKSDEELLIQLSGEVIVITGARFNHFISAGTLFIGFLRQLSAIIHGGTRCTADGYGARRLQILRLLAGYQLRGRCAESRLTVAMVVLIFIFRLLNTFNNLR
jgi:hypothetical protein